MKKKILFVLLLGLILYPANKVTNYNISSVNYKEGNHIKITDYLKDKANGISVNNYNDGNKTEMYTFEHGITDQTGELTDYRYIGDTPNNYILFNCDDWNDSCEVWRIIGVFTVENENGTLEERVKIAYGNGLIDDKKWNSTKINDWTSSDLNIYLNTDYFSKLNDNSKKMVGDTKYYLGAGQENENGNYGSVDDIYTWERGNDVVNGSLTNWIGKVALIYPSDQYYTYGKGVDNICTTSPLSCDTIDDAVPTNSWIYNSNNYGLDNTPQAMWFLSPTSDNIENAFLMFKSGYLNARNDVTNSLLIRPALYLKSNVYYVSGDGSSNNPYSISSDDVVIMSTNQNEDGNNETTIDNASTESNTNNKEAVVDAPNTLSFISKTLLIISGLLIVFGIGLYGYNLYKLKKNSK